MKQKTMKFHSADGPDYEVPVPQEKYKAIGWVVEYQWNGKPKLIPVVYKTKAIAKWETATGASKKTFHRVYVEVKQ